nr:hypothetical protein Iba_chr15aCG13030 [Ipomoea batatas]
MVANLRYGEGGSDSEHLSPEGLRVLRQTWEYPSSKIMELLDLNEEHGAMDEDASMMFEEHIVPATTDGK